MPIPCVDLIIVNNSGEILLGKRANEPARGEWWFPGGRVHYLETRADAAVRKLREECDLEADQLIELSTFDVIVDESDHGNQSHGITTVFVARVGKNTAFKLDIQNSEAEWRLPLDWMKVKLNPFIEQALAVFAKYNEKERS